MALVTILILLSFVSFLLGRYGLKPSETLLVLASKLFPVEATWPPTYEVVVFQVRLPRILAAIIVGSALSLAGCAYQGVFKNPLVSPDILGASAGASLGAVSAIFLSMNAFSIKVMTFAFSMAAVGAAYAVSSRMKRDPTLALVLSGVFVSSLCNALVSFFKFAADPNDKLPTITFWLMGSLSTISMSDLKPALFMTILGGVPLILLRWRINVLSIGDDEAMALGVDVKRLRYAVILCATLLTASTVSISGLIGWVGLVVPHLARLFVGPNHRVLLPAATLMGGAFLLMVDDFARTLSTAEVPLGVLTAIVGAPFFLSMMMREIR
ncbi:MAG: iron ABC transporter permease [Synergistaceae bacterium]|jgi:iron complex transport system permease protein|nr:iron ABC transporter permease [Synergistaceae bacterium]